MAGLLGIVVPLALAAAISPTTLAVELLTLSRKSDALRRAWGVAAGSALVLAGFAVLALILAALVPAYGPPLLVTLLGPRADPLLQRLSGFFTAHRKGIGAGLCFVFAVLLAVAGLKVLL